KRIYFVSDRFTLGLPNLCYIALDAPKEIRQITNIGVTSPYVSSDGIYIFFVSYFEETRGEVYQIHLVTGEIKRITNDKYLDFTIPLFERILTVTVVWMKETIAFSSKKI
ncbi:TolB family protein, partial [Leptospira selangorensis]|uniref:TolB family protein n=1 Tax=Leptospira selangorensis TaxID=2484982 RepID=UPI001FEDECE8